MLEHFRHHVHEIFHKDIETKELYGNLIIRSFAISMIGIFIPIYLLTLGYGLFQVIMQYMLVNYTAALVSLFLSIPLMRRFGIKHSVIFSMPLTIIFLLLLFFVSSNPIPIWLIAAIGGLSHGFYWMGMHSDFSKASGKHGVTKRTGLYFVLPKIGALMGPFIGALIATVYGFATLFIISIAVIATSVIPLMSTRDYNSKATFSLKKIFDTEFKYFLGSVAEGMRNGMEYFFWPVFIFLSLGNVLDVGIAGSVMQIGVMGIPFLITKLHHKIRLTTFMKIGALGYAIIAFMIPSTNPQNMVAVSLILGIVSVLVTVPFYTLSVKESKKFKPAEWVLFREIGTHIGRLILFSVAGIGVYYFTNFHQVFDWIGIFSLFYLFI